jgi:hypothetical protein
MKTAVEWLIQELRGTDDKGDFIFQGVINSELIEQAKEMEKQQIIDAYAQGFIESEIMDKGAEQYYNETFEK